MPFASLGLDASILKAVADQGYTDPTPIQKATIPIILEGTDVIGIAQTGTGKTAAFTLPILTRLVRTKSNTHKAKVRCLILAPTRELVVQIAENVAAYSRYSGATVATCYGGVSERPQIAALRKGCDFLIATPGRLLDLGSQGHGDFSGIECLVLDEADRMLDMGFLPAINTIVRALPKERQTLMFSATLSREIETLTKQYQREPKLIEVGRRSNPAETVTQLLYECPSSLKQVMLNQLLKDEENFKMVLVFARTKHGADRVCRKLEADKIHCAAIHANRSQAQRQRALQAFKNGEVRVLVATDIASRGIDVDGISHVVNFDFPDQLEDYVHRIGRTGRALAKGTAITFITRENQGDLRRLERIIGKHLHCGKLKDFDYSQQAPARQPDDFVRERDPRAGAHNSERSGRPQGGRHGGFRAAQGKYRPFGRPGTRRTGGPK
ncbi:MAG: DEAD/DEAH box helicase [Opitutales bacterium]|nr:DEAD/DEAH box helicase [Opitutales bacterium]